MAFTAKDGCPAAVSALAAASGVGLVSGRQMIVFFAQFGRASWLGILTSSILYGLFCAFVGVLANKTGGRSLTAAAMRSLGTGGGLIVGALYGLILALTMGAMLSECFRLAELTLYVHNAGWMGVILSLGLGMLLNLRGLKAWSLGAIVLCALFFLILALDPREIRYRQVYETVARFDGSIPMAMVFGALHAGLSASVAADAVTEGKAESPRFTGLWAAAGMLSMLTMANLALMRGGIRLLSQRAPYALLAARWGATGFYGCILVKWTCCVATLSHALRGMLGEGKHDKKTC